MLNWIHFPLFRHGVQPTHRRLLQGWDALRAPLQGLCWSNPTMLAFAPQNHSLEVMPVGPAGRISCRTLAPTWLRWKCEVRARSVCVCKHASRATCRPWLLKRPTKRDSRMSSSVRFRSFRSLRWFREGQWRKAQWRPRQRPHGARRGDGSQDRRAAIRGGNGVANCLSVCETVD